MNNTVSVRRAITCLITILFSGTIAAGADQGKLTAEMSARREEAAHRQRRIIFNNDGNDAAYFPASLEATPENILAQRTSPLIDSHVDTIFYCTSRAFGSCLHRSEVAETLTGETRHEAAQEKRNVVGELIRQGTDPLQLMAEFAQSHQKEIFWSMRMNDVHDATNSNLLPRLKKEHPEFLFGTPANPPPYRGFSGSWGSNTGATWGGYSGVDYAQEAVRDHAFRMIEEVCSRYNIEGVELDFFRSPVLFKSHAWGKQVSQAERDTLTELMWQIRRMTDEVSVRRDRPLLISVRVPDSVDYCLAMGIDLERWLEEELVDLLAVGGDFMLSPWEQSVKLGQRHAIPVYAVLTNTARHVVPEFRTRSNAEGYRARALEAWNAGVNGIYIFNLFEPEAPMWHELGDPVLLRTLDRTYYVVSNPQEQVTRIHPDGLRFCRPPTLSPEYPQTLKPDKPLTVTLTVSESMLPNKAGELRLGILPHGVKDPRAISIQLNGKACDAGRGVNSWLEYSVQKEWLRSGSNHVQITLSAAQPARPEIRDVRLTVAGTAQ